MVNHPNRSQKAHDAALRRLVQKHPLQRIDLHVSLSGITARAMPNSFHPLVAKRRDAAFEEKAEWTMEEARRVNEQAMSCVAHVSGDTFDEVIAALTTELAK